jgi:hypothetical protein
MLLLEFMAEGRGTERKNIWKNKKSKSKNEALW